MYVSVSARISFCLLIKWSSVDNFVFVCYFAIACLFITCTQQHCMCGWVRVPMDKGDFVASTSTTSPLLPIAKERLTTTVQGGWMRNIVSFLFFSYLTIHHWKNTTTHSWTHAREEGPSNRAPMPSPPPSCSQERRRKSTTPGANRVSHLFRSLDPYEKAASWTNALYPSPLAFPSGSKVLLGLNSCKCVNKTAKITPTFLPSLLLYRTYTVCSATELLVLMRVWPCKPADLATRISVSSPAIL